MITNKRKIINVGEQAKADYKAAVKHGLTKKDRWGNGIPHHPMSERIMRFLAEHDFADYGDYFCWKVGGDGDNGETLMYEMDAFFEMLDAECLMKQKRKDAIAKKPT